MNAVAREVLLAGEAEDLPVGHEGGDVVKRVAKEEGKTERNDHAARVRQDLLQTVEGEALHVRRLEGVLAAVPGDAEFRQAKERHPALPGLADGVSDAQGVAVPVEGRLVEDSGAGVDLQHWCKYQG